MDRAVALAPNSALSHYNVAVNLTMPGDYARSLRAMERTLVLDPLNVTVARVNAQTQLAAGRWSEAQAYFDECLLRHCLGLTELSFYETIARIHMGQKELALAALERLAASTEGEDLADLRMWLDIARAIIRSEPIVLPEESTADPTSTLGLDPVLGFALASSDHGAAVDYFAMHISDEFWGSFGGEILLSEGALELPDAFRKFSGYREFWDRDGWRDIARARIANGHTAGLPLNEDGSLVEF